MRVPRRLVASVVSLAVSFAVGSPAGATNVPGPLAVFQTQLSALSMRAPGHVGIAVQDVLTGVTTGYNAGAEMPAASTIKIPVMVEVFRQLGTGKFALYTRVKLRRSDKDSGSGDLYRGRVGTSYPVSRLLELMIDVSDNTATNMLIRLVGRTHINQEMEELGLTHTRLTDFIRSEGPHIRWALRSSPADMAHLLRKMARKQLIDEWSSGEMLTILRGQQHNSLLPEPLPEGTDIAHKTGTLHDTLNDVGIVFEGSDPYVIAVMTTDLRTLSSGRRFIRGVSRLAYDALGKFATWRGINDFNPDAEPSVGAPTDAAPLTADQQMWTPQNVPAPVAVPAPTPTP
ncbi:MAG: beta-lactamase class [Candidatus Eremiobacteraeota bacterium]|jgi:beta-lactamase class A|nr:beta-lactamase class [Candidatus Eremiobacteraeota bacterium]